jgi:hypothetical protein
MTQVLIGFSQPNKFMIGAAAIKWWMQTPYCHVYLRVYSRYTEQWLVYQASHGMVNCLTWTNFCNGNKIEKEFALNVDDADLQATVRKAQQLLGQPYGYLGLAVLVLRRIFPALKGDKYGSAHCSEFIACMFPQLAEQLHKEPDFIEPVDLFKVLSAAEVD